MVSWRAWSAAVNRHVGRFRQWVFELSRPLREPLMRAGMVWRCVRPVWFSIVLAVLSLLLGAVPQWGEVVLGLAEEGRLGQQVLTVVAIWLAAFGLWYASRTILYVDFKLISPLETYLTPALRSTAARLPAWRKYMPRALGTAPFVNILIAAALTTSHGAVTAALAALAIGMLALFLYLLSARQRLLKPRDFTELRPVLPNSSTVILTICLLAAALITGLVSYSLVSDALAALPQMLGTVAIWNLALASWAVFGSAVLVYPSLRWRLFPPLIIVLLFLSTVIGDLWNDYSLPARFTDLAPAQRFDHRPSLLQWTDRWVAHQAAARPGEPIPLVVVTTEGGGIRAAYWTAGLLTRLQQPMPPDRAFFDHVFAISGVSGGSLGAVVATAADRTGMHPSRRLELVRDTLSRDFLAPLVAGTLFPDLTRHLLPMPFLPDRQAFLHAAWEVAWRRSMDELAPGGAGYMPRAMDQLAGGFLDLQGASSPLLLLNTTDVRHGGRSIVTGIRFRPDPDRTADCSASSGPFREATDTLTLVGHDIKASEAAGLSARFTYLSPAATIDTPCGTVRLVDGGYFENTGALTAQELFDGLRESGACLGDDTHPDLLRCGHTHEQLVVPLVLVLRYSLAAPINRGDGLAGYLSEASPPIEALLGTRVARSDHAVATLEATKRDHIKKIALPIPDATTHLSDAPLGWTLRKATRDWIDRQIGEQAADIETWFRSSVARLVGAEGVKCRCAGEPPPQAP